MTCQSSYKHQQSKTKRLVIIGLIGALLTFCLTAEDFVYAHPGRTASDGCHYCRTNCASWGVQWNARHCHGGSTTSTNNSQFTGFINSSLEDLYQFPVAEVIDGDTIKIKDTTGDIETVRLIGIDTPETVHPSKPVECFGKEASRFLNTLLEGKKVYIKKDSIGDTRDKYSRLLRYIYLDGTDVNATMIHEGYAYAYTSFPFEKKDEYLNYQKEAEKNKVGLWADGVCGNPDTTTEDTKNNETEGTSTAKEDTTREPVNGVGTNFAESLDSSKSQKSSSPNQNENKSGDDYEGGLGTWVAILILMATFVWIWKAGNKLYQRILRKPKASNAPDS